jgi:hypothetical protein
MWHTKLGSHSWCQTWRFTKIQCYSPQISMISVAKNVPPQMLLLQAKRIHQLQKITSYERINANSMLPNSCWSLAKIVAWSHQLRKNSTSVRLQTSKTADLFSRRKCNTCFLLSPSKCNKCIQKWIIHCIFIAAASLLNQRKSFDSFSAGRLWSQNRGQRLISLHLTDLQKICNIPFCCSSKCNACTLLSLSKCK